MGAEERRSGGEREEREKVNGEERGSREINEMEERSYGRPGGGLAGGANTGGGAIPLP